MTLQGEIQQWIIFFAIMSAKFEGNDVLCHDTISASLVLAQKMEKYSIPVIAKEKRKFPHSLRLLLLTGTNFSILVVRCIWQVLILAFFLMISYVFPIHYKYIKSNRTANKLSQTRAVKLGRDKAGILHGTLTCYSLLQVCGSNKC